MSEPAEIDPFDAEWDRPRWTNRLTWVLVAAVVAALAFAGGLLIERQYDTTILTAARRRHDRRRQRRPADTDELRRDDHHRRRAPDRDGHDLRARRPQARRPGLGDGHHQPRRLHHRHLDHQPNDRRMTRRGRTGPMRISARGSL